MCKEKKPLGEEARGKIAIPAVAFDVDRFQTDSGALLQNMCLGERGPVFRSPEAQGVCEMVSDEVDDLSPVM